MANGAATCTVQNTVINLEARSKPLGFENYDRLLMRPSGTLYLWRCLSERLLAWFCIPIFNSEWTTLRYEWLLKYRWISPMSDRFSPKSMSKRWAFDLRNVAFAFLFYIYRRKKYVIQNHVVLWKIKYYKTKYLKKNTQIISIFQNGLSYDRDFFIHSKAITQNFKNTQNYVLQIKYYKFLYFTTWLSNDRK